MGSVIKTKCGWSRRSSTSRALRLVLREGNGRVEESIRLSLLAQGKAMGCHRKRAVDALRASCLACPQIPPRTLSVLVRNDMVHRSQLLVIPSEAKGRVEESAGRSLARTIHRCSKRKVRGAVPRVVFDPRGAEAHLTVRRAPRGEKTAMGAVHRASRPEAGESSGLGSRAGTRQASSLDPVWAGGSRIEHPESCLPAPSRPRYCPSVHD
jgi:hypothetical protein